MLFPIVVFGQEQQFTTVEIRIINFDREEGFLNNNDTLFLSKISGETIAFTMPLNKFERKGILFQNIPVANYQLIYKNNFEQKVIKKIYLTTKDTNEVFICPDSLFEYSQNTLAKLNDNEDIEILFKSQGCFHESSSTIISSKKDGNYFAELHDYKFCKPNSKLWK